MHTIFTRASAATSAALLVLILLLGVASLPSSAQPPTATLPAPTLVPPTRVPTAIPAEQNPVNYSAVADVQQRGVLRVGVRYGLPPFSYLNERAALVGYEVDILRALAVDLAVEVEFIQVTRETELAMLNAGEVDALIGQQIITRERQMQMDFTHPYYTNTQVMVVQETSIYENPIQLEGLLVGVTVATRTEEALRQSGYNYDLRLYFNEFEAFNALEAGEVQAMVGQYETVRAAGRLGKRTIFPPISIEPYAIALRRHDINLRNLLNRTLQRLTASGRHAEIHAVWFPQEEEPDLRLMVPVYEALYGDQRGFADLPTDLPRPARSVMEKIRNREPLTVVGLSLNPDASAFENQLDTFHQRLVEEMALRWGATVNFVPNTWLNKLDMLFGGQADLAVGVTPIWDGADRFDYSQPYLRRGNRLMVLEGSRFDSFVQMRGGTYVGYWYEDAGMREEIERIAEAYRVRPTPYEVRSVRELVDLFNARTLAGFFGDELRIQALREASAYSGLPFTLSEERFSSGELALALPRADLDFRLLVDWTLQDMFRDGTYQRIFNETVGFGDPIEMVIYPGSNPLLTGGR
ncbi:MAG: transporter substrate-binding domain-containing protein [Anaerolineae bacterium]|nr:transporter substrate-binding domain-containing protein [Anaerolineae bacterium]